MGEMEWLFRSANRLHQKGLSAMRSDERRILVMTVLVCAFVASLLVVAIVSAAARDLGQWSNVDPEKSAWYRSLMQPDVPTVSCCGESDAYWADSFETSGDQYIAIITDPRPDEPLHRRHVEVGTKILVPNNKLKFDQSNPTGHGIIFLSRGDYVFCYVAPGGA